VLPGASKTAHRQECLCHLNPRDAGLEAKGREGCGVARAHKGDERTERLT
jgi:hypothetical protein